MHLAGRVKAQTTTNSFDHEISTYRRYKMPTIEQFELLHKNLNEIRNEDPRVKVLEEGIEKLWAEFPIFEEYNDKDAEKLNATFDLVDREKLIKYF